MYIHIYEYIYLYKSYRHRQQGMSKKYGIPEI
jgi:hypothetical protein